VERDDVAGLTDAMLRVVREPDLPATLRARGLARAATFSWHEGARRLVDELTRVGHRRAA
jgi:glycosyltransferase involved in cell wall biosynthesis